MYGLDQHFENCGAAFLAAPAQRRAPRLVQAGNVPAAAPLQPPVAVRPPHRRRSPLALLQHPCPSLAADRRAPPQNMRESPRSDSQSRARRRQRGCSPSQRRPPLTAPASSRAGWPRIMLRIASNRVTGGSLAFQYRRVVTCCSHMTRTHPHRTALRTRAPLRLA